MSSHDDRLTEWRELLEDQRSSNMSVKEWCESEGISTTTYYYWRKRVSVAPAASSAPPLAPRWLPVVLEDATPCSSGLTLRVGRVSMDICAGFDRNLLRATLDVLEARRC